MRIVEMHIHVSQHSMRTDSLPLKYNSRHHLCDDSETQIYLLKIKTKKNKEERNSEQTGVLMPVCCQTKNVVKRVMCFNVTYQWLFMLLVTGVHPHVTAWTTPDPSARPAIDAFQPWTSNYCFACNVSMSLLFTSDMFFCCTFRPSAGVVAAESFPGRRIICFVAHLTTKKNQHSNKLVTDVIYKFCKTLSTTGREFHMFPDR